MDWFTVEELIIRDRKTKTGLLVSLSELYRLEFHSKSLFLITINWIASLRRILAKLPA